MFDQWGAGFGSKTSDDIDDAVGQSGLHQHLDQMEGGERRVLRRLDHAGVSADQRGEELPRGDSHGEVPGCDHAAHTDRHADRHGELVLQLGGRGLAEETASLARHVVGSVDRLLHVAARLAQHLAHLARHIASELLALIALTSSSSKPVR